MDWWNRVFLIALVLFILQFGPGAPLADDLCLIEGQEDYTPQTFSHPLFSMLNSIDGSVVYLTFFTPGESNFWAGNVLKFRLSEDLELVDENGAPVMLNGVIKDGAKPIWEAEDWAEPDKPNYVHHSGRKIYTFLGDSSDLTSDGNRFSSSNGGLSASILGGPADHTVQQIVDFVRGADVSDGTANRPAILGDIIHSQPAAVHYGFSGPSPTLSETILYVGSNEGILHAVRDSDGTELWGFIPPDQLPHLKDLLEGRGHRYFVDSSPKMYLRDWNRDGLIETDNTTKDWNHDNIIDEDDQDRAVLVCGERKGGANYFAIDVTYPQRPVFLWRIGSHDDSKDGSLLVTEMTGDFTDGETVENETGSSVKVINILDVQGGKRLLFSGRTGEFVTGEIVKGLSSKATGKISVVSHDSPPGAGPDLIIPGLGETWSEPQFGLVKTSDDDTSGTPAFFIGGGYSDDQTAGKAVLAIKIFFSRNDETKVLKEFSLQGMDYCFPSAVRVVDVDGNGFVDKVYVGDTGGQLWRFGNFEDAEGKSLPFPSCNENLSGWTGKVIFRAGTSEENRKFFYPPSVTLEKGYDLLFIGTGDREDVCRLEGSDRIYCIKDAHGSAATWTESNLVDVTGLTPVPNLDNESGDVDENNLPDRGWYIRLPTGEKILESGLVYNRVLYFTTYRPKGEGAGGEGRLYALNYKTGRPALFTDEAKKLTRSKVIGGAIPSRPVIAISGTEERMFVSTGREKNALGPGILALEPAGPSVNFHYLWWKEL